MRFQSIYQWKRWGKPVMRIGVGEGEIKVSRKLSVYLVVTIVDRPSAELGWKIKHTTHYDGDSHTVITTYDSLSPDDILGSILESALTKLYVRISDADEAYVEDWLEQFVPEVLSREWFY